MDRFILHAIFNCIFDGGLSTMVDIADKEMFSTVIRNLISSAIIFTKQEEIITVSIKQRKKESIVAVEESPAILKPRLVFLFICNSGMQHRQLQNYCNGNRNSQKCHIPTKIA